MTKIKNNLKNNWIILLFFYSFLVALIFIVTLLYTQSFLEWDALNSGITWHEEYEIGMHIFWFAPFRASLLALIIIAIISIIVLFFVFNQKKMNLGKKDKIVLSVLFAFNFLLLFLSFTFVSVLISSIDNVLWNLKQHYSHVEKYLIDKKKNVISTMYSQYINKYETFLYLSASFFTLFSIFQIYHFGEIIHKKFKTINEINKIVQK
ncbi:hypothetical protein [Mycoplasmopsis arginini]|uniref:hypothetical protein n=1 Tax=Mycoplasmopsis arginini TaxID=2094 RepID=UPI003D010C20